MNQNGGIHKGGFAVLCHRNGGSESPGILSLLGFGGVAPSKNKPYKPHKYAILGNFELHYINFTLTEISMSI